jgi:hypothetical protein
MKRTAQTLFELADVIGECLDGELHIILIESNDAFKLYRVYSNSDCICFDISMEVMGTGADNNVYSFEPIWQGNNKLSVYTANQILEQFQK